MSGEEVLPAPDGNGRRRILFGELQRRSRWFVRLRWSVPPVIAAAVGIGLALRFEFSSLPILLVAAGILAYNTVLAWVAKSTTRRTGHAPILVQDQFNRRFTAWQVCLDYAAMLLLVHFTGGAGSPLVAFFLFHVICAAILLPRSQAYVFAGVAVVGMTLLSLVTELGWLTRHPIAHSNDAAVSSPSSAQVVVALVCFAASALIAAYLATTIMAVLRARIRVLRRSFEMEQNLNEKLNALYDMVQAVVGRKTLDEVLAVTRTSLGHVLAVKAVSIKLLGDGGRLLRYAAVHGLPETLVEKKAVEVDRSPLNRRIIEGEPFVTGDVSKKELFQFGEDLAAAGLRSVLFVPLRTEHGVIGILGAYCEIANRFEQADVVFCRLVADVVAIAIENASAYESIERLLRDRSRFMLRVAHNLRSPLSAIISMLELVRGSYLGQFNPEQGEYLRRVDRRARTMGEMINELLALAENKAAAGRLQRVRVDLAELAGRIQRTFQDQAARKGLGFTVELPEVPPMIVGDPALIEQMLENLVANAIKYTQQGSVSLAVGCAKDGIRIVVRDTGIGIPAEARDDLFSEFFRAENARQVEELGTGLGLTIVKQIVQLHKGRIEFESQPGQGTCFTVQLPDAGGEEQA